MIKSDQTGWQKTSGCMFYQLVGEICSVNKIMRERGFICDFFSWYKII